MSRVVYVVTVFGFLCLVGNITITAYYKWANIINFTSIDVAVKPEKTIGLWKICAYDSDHNSFTPADCANIDPLSIPSGIIPSWMNWVRAAMIFSCIFNLAGIIALILSFEGLVTRTINKQNMNYIGNFCLMLSSVLTIVSTSIWTAKISDGSLNMNGMGIGGGGSILNSVSVYGMNPVTLGDCVIAGWCIGQ